MTNPWEEHNDLLNFKSIGTSFTNLIKSLGSARVVSIEAGFGRGKTFFRKAWAKELEQSGEVVIQIDLQQSDHSGDPIITLLGALADALPRDEGGKGKKALESVKKLGAIGTRAAVRLALKSGADELIDLVSESVTCPPKLPSF